MRIIEEKLRSIKERNLYREISHFESPQNKEIKLEGNTKLLLGSNSYMALSDDNQLISKAQEILTSYGLGAGGSRLTTGSYDINRELEIRIADLKGTDESLVFSTGYMANIGVISALCDRNWIIFSDKLNHASIIDGCILSGAKLVRYKHCDMKDLEKKLIKNPASNRLIITDTIFSMDGDVAPLKEIVELAKKYDVYTMVDDAHGFGVFGSKGAGVPSMMCVEKDIDIHVGTLSKAVPSIGGFVAGSSVIVDYLRNSARSFIFTTGLPPVNTAIALYSIDRLMDMDNERKHLIELSRRTRDRLRNEGFNIIEGITPIIPIIIGDESKCIDLKEALQMDGIFINAIRPPTVPKNTSRLRMSLMASHTSEDIEYAIDRITVHAKRLGII